MKAPRSPDLAADISKTKAKALNSYIKAGSPAKVSKLELEHEADRGEVYLVTGTRSTLSVAMHWTMTAIEPSIRG